MQHGKIVIRKEHTVTLFYKCTLTDDERLYHVLNVFLFFHVLTFLTY